MAQHLFLLEKGNIQQNDMLSLMDRLTMRALDGHNQQTSLQGDIDLLHAHGWLFACAPEAAGGVGLSYQSASVDLAQDFFFRLGCANLALGRLFEGHVNACKLVHMLASPAHAETVWARVARGAFLGVWGADSRNPVMLNTQAGENSSEWRKSLLLRIGQR